MMLIFGDSAHNGLRRNQDSLGVSVKSVAELRARATAPEFLSAVAMLPDHWTSKLSPQFPQYSVRARTMPTNFPLRTTSD